MQIARVVHDQNCGFMLLTVVLAYALLGWNVLAYVRQDSAYNPSQSHALTNTCVKLQTLKFDKSYVLGLPLAWWLIDVLGSWPCLHMLTLGSISCSYLLCAISIVTSI